MIRNILSVDVEEYFHPTELVSWVRPDQWTTLPSLVEPETRRVLEIFDRHHVTGTFFVLGWVAHRYPGLIREIASRGHEIGCHSFSHRLVYDLTPAEFREDTRRAIEAIREACGITPRAYRAPSYSVTERSLWALEVLVELGFTHDSSIYPIEHDRYGIPGFGRRARSVATPSGAIFEVPIATAELSHRQVTPVGGGAYMRLLPYRYTAAGIRRINASDQQPACMYLHPWELNAHHPRLARNWLSRLRTYGGLRSMSGKLERLLADFEFGPLTSVYASPPAAPLEAATSP
jgi:polysaccharide deacetylase family protein (PEP-CTERM system associated)